MMRLVFVAVLSCLALGCDSCTTLVAGRLATTDGSTLAAHTDDGLTDPRIMYIPARSHAPNSVRPVFPSPEVYPRYVGYDRGVFYHPLQGQNISQPLGHIPQVAHTFAYLQGTYGIMNEFGLGIAESTCSGIFVARPIGQGGNALFSVDELSYIAMERCKTSRCAVQTMGDLAVEHGFYGAGAYSEGSSESLLVHDGDEAFIFHVMPDPTASSAIWAAQRVPDTHVAVVANMFVIRSVNLTDSFNFLGSANMFTIAQQKGLWNSSVPFDWTAIYSAGEYGHRYYSGRRMWRFLSLATESTLPDTYDNLKDSPVYPTTVSAAKPVDAAFFAFVLRDFYNGTKYDMAADGNLAGGPWGDPDRYGTWDSPVRGNWERSIGVYRTAYAHITQANSQLQGCLKGRGGITWFASDKPSTSVFLPFLVAPLPVAFSIGQPSVIDKKAAYWLFRYVWNIVRIKYRYMMDVVRRHQEEAESAAANLIARLQAAPDVRDAVAETHALADSVLQVWSALPDELILLFADGYNTPTYPDWWLKAVGYEHGPPPSS